MASLACERDPALEGRLGSFDRRIHQRTDIRLDGLACSSPSRHSQVRVIDISASGCRLRDRKGAYEQGQCITFSLNGEVVVEGIVRWWKDYHCGVEFLAPMPEGVLASIV
jgi:hypothetical protein